MLTAVRLHNYRCFRDVTVELGPLTVFVGPNASGKTGLLTALTYGAIGPDDVYQRDPRLAGKAWIEWRKEDGRVDRFTEGGRARTNSDYSAQYLHLDIEQMRQPRQSQEEWELASNGYNLVNVFATLTRAEQGALAAELARLVPAVRDVNVRPLEAGVYRFIFQDRWKPQLSYEAGAVSHGTLFTLALLVLQYQASSPDLIAIEELEHGLHPYLLGEIVATLRKLAHGENGSKPVQIVLATHSAELLDHLEPAEVRFLRRNVNDGSVTVEQADTQTDDWKAAYAAYQRSLGSLWLSGQLGGVPGG